jgi:hypothetical protein
MLCNIWGVKAATLSADGNNTFAQASERLRLHCRSLTSQARSLGGSSFPELNFNVISRDLSDFGKLQELL